MTDDQPAPNGGVLTASDVTALMGLMSGMLDRMEGRILARLDDNSRMASERWTKHDQELEANTKRVIKRFEEIERDLLTVSRSLEAHLAKEHDDAVAIEARTRPVRSLLGWLIVNWKNVALLLIALLTALGILGVEWRAVGGP